MKKVLISIGTRPNIIKITQFQKLAKSRPDLDLSIVHTGQHYDHSMAEVFFDQFEIEPDFRLTLSRGDSFFQMGEMMSQLSALIEKIKPDIVLTPGDVNSTFAAAFASQRSAVQVGHIESGLRSFDRSMPEEVNRILTDEISDYLFVTEPSGIENLSDGIYSKKQIHYVGNTMIDTLVAFDRKISKSEILAQIGIKKQEFLLLTFHRPSNVDSVEAQKRLVELILMLASKQHCVFPMHPRTKKNLQASSLFQKIEECSDITLLEPLGYFEFQNLVKNALGVITDSGGIQEETTFRQVPCITLRPNTERPVTTQLGSNLLLPFNNQRIDEAVKNIVNRTAKKGVIPELWDGLSTVRILDVLEKKLA
jgi:UDP-N-acetylglucosamine 2-epimerase (non-hydrolysing)